ncbi:exodeoxyribonuclease V subunit beta [bacterium (Candidatus Blackallbacteria) CG17_big_fil_post_rev_8_21_14_2_50_48_46]|uniref:DNA 3'-5' helicase n=1 Tax=bacterium (Candidatus Blackallbacteria) CG17_big_fil_post_rev_8_21_14_2_50_48_46 TaxID=2014261 RepID=A0A2M7FY37_9BACT|nr:MAG: exodeoxyribonuclease V subunit beta [bacterium (Candidatus Blackallbacteria) CG18_big_fil_WC_8_21_14_2_50_49_26]PIW14224.1 MAG: exodeoxyribonuclease V subunit beta [bacterium (Candidatus Blackallbacteria) CG17_big_fil_post_rev_8_21_14_2_50_48_46]PIW46971.1 MAG: exodeoxyribonuclease V subunit beta [bacterium (Candidatus Blackallbacteria) CG13_big_fil_rev_8_21_14_2_50_49_14]
MSHFDLATCALDGVHMIEASAGTGKTYTLVNLCLRLIAEKGYRVQELGVVTFTEAATQELTWRLRLRLKQALEALAQGSSEDPFFKAWLWHQDADLMQRLKQALRDLDLARISTIHAFCQWALSRFPLHSGQPFQIEVLSDQQVVLAQAVQDFWRQRMYRDGKSQLRPVLEAGWTPECLQKEISPYLNLSALKLEPEKPEDPEALAQALERVQAEFEQAFALARTLWVNETREILAQAMQLKGGSTFQARYLDGRAEALSAYFADFPARMPHEKDKLEYFSLALIQAKNKGPAVSHAFFGAVQTLLNASEALLPYCQESLLLWQHQLAQAVGQHVSKGKLARQQLSFEDLLIQLHAALHDPERGEALAQVIRQAQPVALIDEFQDTDPLQYAIFSKLYPQGPLFLIGDPKQAIYAFRGADIHTYLKARQDLLPRQPQTLFTNFRSSPDLIAALEQFFKRPETFAHAEIPFVSVQSGRQKQEWRAPAGDAALEIAWIQAPEEQKLSKEKVWENLPAQVASEMVQMLASGEYALKDSDTGEFRPLAAQDIAVLVRTHAEGQEIRAALRQRQVPCVLYSQESVFQTPEAEALQTLLETILTPGRRDRLLPVLVGVIFNQSLSEVYALQNDATGWEFWQESFLNAHQDWLEKGFARMWAGLVRRHAIYARLLTTPEGERRVTNLRHLSELLQAYEQAHDPGLRQLCDWLRRERLELRTDQESLLLQLETDRQAVQILTIHRSKGLEFPVVFCPSLWEGRKMQVKAPLLSAEPQTRQLVLDLGSEHLQERAKQRSRESQEEDLRLVYVALTRARYKLWLAWGFVNQIEFSALGHWFPAENAQELFSTLQAEVGLSQGRWHLKALGEPTRLKLARSSGEPSENLFLPPWPQIASAYQTASFSFLTARQGVNFELPGADLPDEWEENTEQALPELTENPEGPLMALPRGSRQGRFLHLLLEKISAQTPVDALPAQLLPWLRRYGFDATVWLDPLLQALPLIWQTPLEPVGFSLAELEPRQRLHEWEFYFPVRQTLTPEMLQDVFRQHQSPWGDLPALNFYPLQGYFKGFIDLVCAWKGVYYVLDYKSNGLGLRWRDYAPDALLPVVAAHAYALQLHLYLVALHRYLRYRLADYDPDLHLGGGFCLFLRGLHPEHAGSGIFFERPSTALVLGLSELFGE